MGIIPLLIFSSGCISYLGLTELSELPPDFPITTAGEVGHITRSQNTGQVSIDVAYEHRNDADQAWKVLIAQAESRGFTLTEKKSAKKRDRVILERADGKLELACCRQRVDKYWLVYASWWAAAQPTE